MLVCSSSCLGHFFLLFKCTLKCLKPVFLQATKCCKIIFGCEILYKALVNELGDYEKVSFKSATLIYLFSFIILSKLDLNAVIVDIG